MCRTVPLRKLRKQNLKLLIITQRDHLFTPFAIIAAISYTISLQSGHVKQKNLQPELATLRVPLFKSDLNNYWIYFKYVSYFRGSVISARRVYRSDIQRSLGS